MNPSGPHHPAMTTKDADRRTSTSTARRSDGDWSRGRSSSTRSRGAPSARLGFGRQNPGDDPRINGDRHGYAAVWRKRPLPIIDGRIGKEDA